MKTVSDIFGTLVFDDRQMKARLPHDVYISLKKTIDEGGSLDNQVANVVADALSQLSMGSVAHVEDEKKELVRDVHRLV